MVFSVRGYEMILAQGNYVLTRDKDPYESSFFFEWCMHGWENRYL